MGQIVLSATYQGVDVIEGKNIYSFSVYALSTDFLPSFGTGRMSRWLSRAIPEPSICDYLPKTIPQGETWPGWATHDMSWSAPVDLYILGAELHGGLGLEIDAPEAEKFSAYLITLITVYYSEYPPDDSGHTLLPGWEPTTSTHFEMPMPSGFSAFVPKGDNNFTWNQFVSISYGASSYSGIYSNWAWIFNGCTINSSSHILYALKNSSLPGITPDNFGEFRYQYTTSSINEFWLSGWTRPEYPEIRFTTQTGPTYKCEIYFDTRDGLYLPSLNPYISPSPSGGRGRRLFQIPFLLGTGFASNYGGDFLYTDDTGELLTTEGEEPLTT